MEEKKAFLLFLVLQKTHIARTWHSVLLYFDFFFDGQQQLAVSSLSSAYTVSASGWTGKRGRVSRACLREKELEESRLRRFMGGKEDLENQ